MVNDPAFRSLQHTRLVRFLAGITESDAPLSHEQFCQRLARWFDIAESDRLADTLWQLPRIRFDRGESDNEPDVEQPARRVQALFISQRKAMAEAVLNSFSPGVGYVRIRLPGTKKQDEAGESPGYEAYRRFYLAHQREMEAKVAQLQDKVREEASALSVELARLAALDRVVIESLGFQSKKWMARIPRILARRFDALRDEAEKGGCEEACSDGASSEDGKPVWLNTFCNELQGVLLAELEVRLLPALGLVEAVNEQVDRNK
ncbi:MAG: hypothetical protein CSB48_03515 [Proteobacteria bacterium]|nr:MAG: hypothetical protein CSB48_03515 [Pseudomonadota bacterium]